MDLFSEATGTRTLTPRHIIPEKVLAEMDDAINTTVSCYNLSVQPDFRSYYAALEEYAWILWPCAVVILSVVCGLFAATVRAAKRHWSDSGDSLIVVLAVYPLVAVSGLIVLLVPRARLLAEAAAQQAVMVAMYHFYCMLLTEAGGVDKLVRRAGGSRLETRVLPCCCLPCCVIPRPKLDRKSLTWLRYLVFQLPIVQGLLYTVILVIWAEDMLLYTRSFIYFQPFVITSIVSGVWGVNMMVRLAESAGISCRRRFLSLQLMLIAVKVQCGIAKVLPEMLDLPCVLALNPAVVVHMIQYSIMMLEVLLLSLWAWRLYRLPPGPTEKVHQVVVAVLEDGGGDFRPIKDVMERSLANGNGNGKV